jgi:predicted ATPase
MNEDSTFVTRVMLHNYKSIAACDVRLGALTFLVGPNGAGKSNFLDALRFVADGLRLSLDQVVRERGGQAGLQYRASVPEGTVGMRLEFALPDGVQGHYALLLKLELSDGYRVEREQCVLRRARRAKPLAYFSLDSETVQASFPDPPAATREQLYLVRVSGIKEFQTVYERLQSMRFYHLNTDNMRAHWPRDVGQILLRDGSNVADVLDWLDTRNPTALETIEEYVKHVVPSVSGVHVDTWGGYKFLAFEQNTSTDGQPWRFGATNVSDGTLRALGTLVALFQSANGAAGRLSLVGIEEPELQLHPAAAGALRDSLREAAAFTQVAITSHSPDLLDDPKVLPESILAVVCEGGRTRIGPVDAVGLSVLRDRLYTAGELLRLGQLLPDEPPSSDPDPSALFDVVDSPA